MGVQKQRGEADEGCDEGEVREMENSNLAQDAEEEAEETSSSSAPSSPLCQPYIQREVLQTDSSGESIYKPSDRETFEAYEQSDAKFQEKQGLPNQPLMISHVLFAVECLSCVF